MDVQLEPPVGTCYFKSYNDKVAGVTADGAGQAAINVTFYIYATLVPPTDPDFAKKGGKIYIIVVYRGTATATKPDELQEFYFGIRPLYGVWKPSSIIAYPALGSEEIVNGDKATYPINFAQTLSMYSDGGQSPYSFPARYKRTYSLTGYRQIDHDDNLFLIKRDKEAKKHNNKLPIGALQIFESDKFATGDCVIYFKFSEGTKPFEKSFRLDFSAETMAKAVVG